MSYRRLFFVNQIGPDVSSSIGRLAGLEGFTRAILVGVIPLIAFKVFGSKDAVATVYFLSTVFTLLFTLNIQFLEKLFNRRGLVTLAGALLVLTIIFYYSEITPLFTIGIGIQAAGASIFSVCISLYVMDYIGKTELTKAESKRMLYAGAAWLIGPTLGSWLLDNGLGELLYLIAGLSALGMIAYFWWLRLGDDAVIKVATSQSANPLRAVIRFWKQPNLRIAYLITTSRACYWVTLFVYGPIYVVEAGLPTWVGGLLLSGASGFLFLSPVIQRLATHFGTRQVLISCLVLIGLSLVALGLVGEAKPIGITFFVTAALGGASMDVLGNIPFMRMVKPRERVAMTTVFTTWRESSSLLTQALVFLTLLVAPFWVFYLILALLQFLTAIAATFLPKRI